MKKIAIIIVSLILGLSIQAQTTTKSDTSVVKPTPTIKKFDTSKIHHKEAIAPQKQQYIVPSATKVTATQVKTPPAVTKGEE